MFWNQCEPGAQPYQERQTIADFNVDGSFLQAPLLQPPQPRRASFQRPWLNLLEMDFNTRNLQAPLIGVPGSTPPPPPRFKGNRGKVCGDLLDLDPCAPSAPQLPETPQRLLYPGIDRIPKWTDQVIPEELLRMTPPDGTPMGTPPGMFHMGDFYYPLEGPASLLPDPCVFGGLLREQMGAPEGSQAFIGAKAKRDDYIRYHRAKVDYYDSKPRRLFDQPAPCAPAAAEPAAAEPEAADPAAAVDGIVAVRVQQAIEDAMVQADLPAHMAGDGGSGSTSTEEVRGRFVENAVENVQNALREQGIEVPDDGPPCAPQRSMISGLLPAAPYSPEGGSPLERMGELAEIIESTVGCLKLRKEGEKDEEESCESESTPTQEREIKFQRQLAARINTYLRSQGYTGPMRPRRPEEDTELIEYMTEVEGHTYEPKPHGSAWKYPPMGTLHEPTCPMPLSSDDSEAEYSECEDCEEQCYGHMRPPKPAVRPRKSTRYNTWMSRKFDRYVVPTEGPFAPVRRERRVHYRTPEKVSIGRRRQMMPESPYAVALPNTPYACSQTPRAPPATYRVTQPATYRVTQPATYRVMKGINELSAPSSPECTPRRPMSSQTAPRRIPVSSPRPRSPCAMLPSPGSSPCLPNIISPQSGSPQSIGGSPMSPGSQALYMDLITPNDVSPGNIPCGDRPRFPSLETERFIREGDWGKRFGWSPPSGSGGSPIPSPRPRSPRAPSPCPRSPRAPSPCPRSPRAPSPCPRSPPRLSTPPRSSPCPPLIQFSPPPRSPRPPSPCPRSPPRIPAPPNPCRAVVPYRMPQPYDPREPGSYDYPAGFSYFRGLKPSHPYSPRRRAPVSASEEKRQRDKLDAYFKDLKIQKIQKKVAMKTPKRVEVDDCGPTPTPPGALLRRRQRQGEATARWYRTQKGLKPIRRPISPELDRARVSRLTGEGYIYSPEPHGSGWKHVPMGRFRKPGVPGYLPNPPRPRKKRPVKPPTAAQPCRKKSPPARPMSPETARLYEQFSNPRKSPPGVPMSPETARRYEGFKDLPPQFSNPRTSPPGVPMSPETARRYEGFKDLPPDVLRALSSPCGSPELRMSPPPARRAAGGSVCAPQPRLELRPGLPQPRARMRPPPGRKPLTIGTPVPPYPISPVSPVPCPSPFSPVSSPESPVPRRSSLSALPAHRLPANQPTDMCGANVFSGALRSGLSKGPTTLSGRRAVPGPVCPTRTMGSNRRTSPPSVRSSLTALPAHRQLANQPTDVCGTNVFSGGLRSGLGKGPTTLSGRKPVPGPVCPPSSMSTNRRTSPPSVRSSLTALPAHRQLANQPTDICGSTAFSGGLRSGLGKGITSLSGRKAVPGPVCPPRMMRTNQRTVARPSTATGRRATPPSPADRRSSLTSLPAHRLLANQPTEICGSNAFSGGLRSGLSKGITSLSGRKAVPGPVCPPKFVPPSSRVPVASGEGPPKRCLSQLPAHRLPGFQPGIPSMRATQPVLRKPPC